MEKYGDEPRHRHRVPQPGDCSGLFQRAVKQLDWRISPWKQKSVREISFEESRARRANRLRFRREPFDFAGDYSLSC